MTRGTVLPVYKKSPDVEPRPHSRGLVGDRGPNRPDTTEPSELVADSETVIRRHPTPTEGSYETNSTEEGNGVEVGRPLFL